jgi:excisionase family DNA binding protein
MHEAKPIPAPLLTLTVREALRATGLGRTTLYKLIATGQVRRVKIGKRVLIPYADLQALVTPEACSIPLDQDHGSPLDAGEAAA